MALAVALGSATLPAHANDAALKELRQQIDELRSHHESRIQALERKLEQAQQQAQPGPAATAAAAPAAATAPSAVAMPPKSLDNRFNPSMSVILSGTYASLKRDPDSWELSGFQPGDDGHGVGPGERGFNLGELRGAFPLSRPLENP